MYKDWEAYLEYNSQVKNIMNKKIHGLVASVEIGGAMVQDSSHWCNEHPDQ